MPLASVLVSVPGSLGEVLDELPQSSCSRLRSQPLPFARLLFTKSRGPGGERGSSPSSGWKVWTVRGASGGSHVQSLARNQGRELGARGGP